MKRSDIGFNSLPAACLLLGSIFPTRVEMSSKKFELGDRVSTGAGPNMKQGLIAFIGETQFSAGEWIGIVLDSPEGKNDGSVAGVVYFECEPNFGLFVKAAQVKLVAAQHQPPPLQASPAAAVASSPVAIAASSTGPALSSPAASAEKDTRDKLAALREKRKAREAASLAPPAEPQAMADSLVGEVSGLGAEVEADNTALLLRAKAAEETIAILQRQLGTKETDHAAQVVALNKMIDSLEASSASAASALLKDKEGAGPESEKMREMQNQILDLMDTVEMMTLDKEQLSVDNELLEETRGKLKAQVVSLTAELAESRGGSGLGAQQQQSLGEENAKLREALKRLHEVSSQDKLSALSSNREAESSALELVELRQYKMTATKEIEQLKRTLNESKADDYESIIEKLSERNQMLGEQKRQLEITVGDLESAQELMDELDVNQRAEIDHLTKSNDAAQIALLERDQAIKALEERLSEMKGNVDKVVLGMHFVKDESEALKMKLQIRAEELQESTFKLQTNRAEKQDIMALSEELKQCRERETEADSIAAQALIVNVRLKGVFEQLAIWTQEKDFLARELHAISMARKASQLAATRKRDLLQVAMADRTTLLQGLALLEGARQCWSSAALALSSSANSTLDTSAAHAAIFGNDGNALLQLIQHVSKRDLKASTVIESWICLSFLLASIELFSICIPKIAEVIEKTHSQELMDACKTLSAEFGTNLYADALAVDIPHNLAVLSRMYKQLFSVVTEQGTDVEQILQECISQLKSLKVLRGVTNGGSILNGSLLVLWASDPSSGLTCEWVGRVETLRGIAMQQETDVRKYHETAEASRVMQLQYEMRQEEARAAMARAEELRKMLDSYAGTSEKGDVLKEKKYLEEIKTLTDALEVMEQRNDSVERELKKRGKTITSIASTVPSTYLNSTQSDNSIYWRKIALQRMMQTLPALSGSHPITRRKQDDAMGAPYRFENVISDYRAARKQRALIRVRSVK